MVKCIQRLISSKAYNLYKLDLQKNPNIEPQARIFLWYFRLGSTSKGILKLFCKYKLRNIRLKYGLEIGMSTSIGKGLYLGHAFNITINPQAVIGDNVSIHKGVLIGASNRGSSKGVPTIGNKVWIGCNAAIVGRINIGVDVLIAPNTYVNCNCPPHCVVFGNPAIIKHRENATEGYINSIV